MENETGVIILLTCNRKRSFRKTGVVLKRTVFFWFFSVFLFFLVSFFQSFLGSWGVCHLLSFFFTFFLLLLYCGASSSSSSPTGHCSSTSSSPRGSHFTVVGAGLSGCGHSTNNSAAASTAGGDGGSGGSGGSGG